MIFNPLLKEYKLLKGSYYEARQDGSKLYTEEVFLNELNKLLTSQPGYEEALEYVLLEEKESNEENNQEDVEEDER